MREGKNDERNEKEQAQGIFPIVHRVVPWQQRALSPQQRTVAPRPCLGSWLAHARERREERGRGAERGEPGERERERESWREMNIDLSSVSRSPLHFLFVSLCIHLNFPSSPAPLFNLFSRPPFPFSFPFSLLPTIMAANG